jgi:uncharacterized OsmC-like protein
MTTALARLDASVQKLRDDPDSGISSPTVTATLANGRARLSSGSFNWDADLGPAVGGENLAPSPTAYLLGALAGCGVVFLRDTLAPLFGVTIDDLSATASCTADAAGLLGIDGADPALTGIALTIRITSPDATDRIDAMLKAWKQRCPVYLALTGPNAVALSFEIAARTHLEIPSTGSKEGNVS